MMPVEFDVAGKVVFITGPDAASAKEVPRSSLSPGPISRTMP